MSQGSSPPFRFPVEVKWKWLKKIFKLELGAYPECHTIKEEHKEMLRTKRIMYIHRYPDRWEILQTYPEVKY